MNKIPICICHLPFVQTLKNLAFLFKLKLVSNDIHYIMKEHENFTEKVIEHKKLLVKKHENDIKVSENIRDLGEAHFDKETFENYIAELYFRCENYNKSRRFQQNVLANAATFKLSETFLEGAPQAQCSKICRKVQFKKVALLQLYS